MISSSIGPSVALRVLFSTSLPLPLFFPSSCVGRSVCLILVIAVVYLHYTAVEPARLQKLCDKAQGAERELSFRRIGWLSYYPRGWK